MKNDRSSKLARRRFLQYSAAAAAAGAMTQGLGRAAFAAGDPVHFSAWSAAVDQVKSHVAAFENSTGIKVDYSNAPWAQYRDAMITKFVGNAPLDMLWVSDSWLPEWADAGWIEPVDDFDFLMKYNAEAEQFCTDSMTYKGRQYGLTYYTDFMGCQGGHHGDAADLGRRHRAGAGDQGQGNLGVPGDARAGAGELADRVHGRDGLLERRSIHR
jgi:multiple sugar transport system substrate-binding protein